MVDDGQGIGSEFLPHIFDAFRQEESIGVRRHEGLGLGLYIARQIAQAHQGRLEVRSTPGEGAEFVLTLPLPAQPAA